MIWSAAIKVRCNPLAGLDIVFLHRVKVASAQAVGKQSSVDCPCYSDDSIDMIFPVSVPSQSRGRLLYNFAESQAVLHHLFISWIVRVCKREPGIHVKVRYNHVRCFIFQIQAWVRNSFLLLLGKCRQAQPNGFACMQISRTRRFVTHFKGGYRMFSPAEVIARDIVPRRR